MQSGARIKFFYFGADPRVYMLLFYRWYMYSVCACFLASPFFVLLIVHFSSLHLKGNFTPFVASCLFDVEVL